MATETLFETKGAAEGEKLPTPDFWNWWATEKLNAPEGWHWMTLDAAPESVPDGFVKVEGAVCPRRPDKSLNWRGRQRGTELTFFVPLELFKAFKQEKATAAGVCLTCWGHGREWYGWGKVGGHRYRECPACKGTGKPARKPRGQGRVGKRKAEACAAARAQAGGAPVVVTLPIRTVNPLNQRSQWRVVAKRSKGERLATRYAMLAENLPALPVVITLTRLSRGEMDSDGLAASFKAVRDGIADAYGCGDGSRSGLAFTYAQEKAKAFGVRIEVAAVTAEGGGASATVYHPTTLHNRASQVGVLPKRQAGSAEGGGNP